MQRARRLPLANDQSAGVKPTHETMYPFSPFSVSRAALCRLLHIGTRRCCGAAVLLGVLLTGTTLAAGERAAGGCAHSIRAWWPLLRFSEFPKCFTCIDEKRQADQNRLHSWCSLQVDACVRTAPPDASKCRGQTLWGK